MFSILKFLTIFFVISLQNGEIDGAELKWWQTASFYQVYPRSFKDSDGDGIGDLKGITEKLAYLKEIGITATWVSPIFTSPMVDFGYDVANFTEIDPMFGTMEDFENLIAKAKKIGMKIIIDFVPNHSSDECEWFIKSAANDSYYKDFYIWNSGKIVNGERQPPTNWISLFRGSQWTWHEGRQQYYLHQFHHKQPDFNYRHPEVMKTMKEVLRFWVDKGVDGFRVDAIPYIYEAPQDEYGNWPDEPRNPSVSDPTSYDYLLHIYTKDQPETMGFVYELRAIIDEFQAELGGDDRIILTEAYAPLDITMDYYGNSTMDGAQIPFNFALLSYLRADSDAPTYESTIKIWLDNMPEGRTANWQLGNHDNKRISTRLGADRVDMLNMLLLTLPGCSVTYNGEEIGMTDVWISWEDTVDPQACQADPALFEFYSRDPCRTPFQWNDEKFSGFSDGNTTWLPVADNYAKVNVKRQRSFPGSHLNIYKQLQKLRHLPTMQYGDTDVRALNRNVVAIKRSYTGHSTYIALLNVMDGVEMINLHDTFDGLSNKVQYYIVTDRSLRRKGDLANAGSILLLPKEAIVLRTL